MKKIILFILPVLLAIVVFGVVTFFISRSTPSKGALQVTSVPQSEVYLNGKLLGKSPLCKCDTSEMLPTGDYSIKLVPMDNSYPSYEDKISINPSVLSVVDRTFSDPGKASGSIITLSPVSNKNAQLFISSFPDGVTVQLDNNNSGMTPLLLQNITQSDHEIDLSKEGYKTKIVRIHGVSGYKLSVMATLSADAVSTATSIPTPTASLSAAPTPTVALLSQVIILSTPTGFLRVRDTPSLAGAEISQVHPGELYPFISEQDGWLQIKLVNGNLGWVSNSYAKKK